MGSSEELEKEGKDFSVKISGRFRCRDGSNLRFGWDLFALLLNIFMGSWGAVGVIFGHFCTALAQVTQFLLYQLYLRTPSVS